MSSLSLAPLEPDVILENDLHLRRRRRHWRNWRQDPAPGDRARGEVSSGRFRSFWGVLCATLLNHAMASTLGYYASAWLAGPLFPHRRWRGVPGHGRLGADPGQDGRRSADREPRRRVSSRPLLTFLRRRDRRQDPDRHDAPGGALPSDIPGDGRHDPRYADRRRAGGADG